MVKFIKKSYHITVGHYNAGLEHCAKHRIKHKVKMTDAFLTTLYDYMFNYTVYDAKYKSYVIYEKVKKRTIGLEVMLVTAVYVPIEYRGNGIASKMLDSIDGIVVNGKGEEENEIGRLYVRGKVL